MIDALDRIPFNRPGIVGREYEYIRRAVEAMHTSGDGTYSRHCAAAFERDFGVRRALLTPSCTDALEMTAILMGIEPEDEVIIPAFAFVSTVNAYVLRGARPVFADIRPDTMNLDESRLERLITDKTRAIVLVHYAGVACEMDAILEIANRHGVPVIEDNAHGLYATYGDRPLGSLGRMATLSFHETKNFICGEGGALLLNDPADVERAEIVRDKGTNRQQMFRGEVDKYTWVDLGSSYVLSDILAAFLFAQIEQRDRVLDLRRGIWDRYDARFRGEVERYGVQLPHVPDGYTQGYHMYYMVLPSLKARHAFLSGLADRAISAVFHYTPLHLSRMGRTFGGENADCPVTERISDCLVRLPFFNGLGDQDQDRVTRAVMEVLAVV